MPLGFGRAPRCLVLAGSAAARGDPDSGTPDHGRAVTGPHKGGQIVCIGIGTLVLIVIIVLV